MPVRAFLPLLAFFAAAGALPAQAPRHISLDDAIGEALRTNPQLAAARQSVRAAAAAEVQAAAVANPVFSLTKETGVGSGQETSQVIAALSQPLELGGQRGARREAARLRHEAAVARLRRSEADLVFEVRRAYALAIAADARAGIATAAAAAFAEARRVSAQRLASGDVSGFEHRRLTLEATRYAAQREALAAERRTARRALALLSGTATEVVSTAILRRDSLGHMPEGETLDSLRARALRLRPDLMAVTLDAQAAAADELLARRERLPNPVLSGGALRERQQASPGADVSLRGVALGLSMPLPLWDRRAGAVEQARATADRATAEAAALRRVVAMEIADALDQATATARQLDALRPQLGNESLTALRAAQAAYREGEATLLEWMDAERAYYEAESAFAGLEADAFVSRAALDRALGVSPPPTHTDGTPEGAPRSTRSR